MIIRIVKLSLDPSKLEVFLREFDSIKEQIRAFPGCSCTELLTETENSGIVFTYSHWNSIDDLEKYRNSEFFKSTWARVKPLFIARAEAWSLNKQVEN